MCTQYVFLFFMMIIKWYIANPIGDRIEVPDGCWGIKQKIGLTLEHYEQIWYWAVYCHIHLEEQKSWYQASFTIIIEWLLEKVYGHQYELFSHYDIFMYIVSIYLIPIYYYLHIVPLCTSWSINQLCHGKNTYSRPLGIVKFRAIRKFVIIYHFITNK